MTNEQIEAIKTRRAAFRANTISAEDFLQLTTKDIDALLAALEQPAQPTVETSNSYRFTPGEPCPYVIESVRQPIADVQPAQSVTDEEVTRIYVALKSAMGEDVFTLRTEIRFIADAVLAEMGRR